MKSKNPSPQNSGVRAEDGPVDASKNPFDGDEHTFIDDGELLGGPPSPGAEAEPAGPATLPARAPAAAPQREAADAGAEAAFAGEEQTFNDEGEEAAKMREAILAYRENGFGAGPEREPAKQSEEPAEGDEDSEPATAIGREAFDPPEGAGADEDSGPATAIGQAFDPPEGAGADEDSGPATAIGQAFDPPGPEAKPAEKAPKPAPEARAVPGPAPQPRRTGKFKTKARPESGDGAEAGSSKGRPASLPAGTAGENEHTSILELEDPRKSKKIALGGGASKGKPVSLPAETAGENEHTSILDLEKPPSASPTARKTGPRPALDFGEDEATAIGVSARPFSLPARKPDSGRAPAAAEHTLILDEQDEQDEPAEDSGKEARSPSRAGAFSRSHAGPEAPPPASPKEAGIDPAVSNRLKLAGGILAGLMAVFVACELATSVEKPSGLDLEILYPYGESGAHGRKGQTAPGVSMVSFEYLGTKPCHDKPDAETCLIYEYSRGAFRGTMLLQNTAESGWKRVSDEGLPFLPLR